MQRTKKGISVFLTLVMVFTLIPAISVTFTEKPKAYSTFSKNWSTEFYYPAGTQFVKNIYVAWWSSGNADKMAGIVGASGDYYIEDGYHTRHYNNHSGAVWDKDLNRGCGSSSDDVYIGYDFTSDPTAENACKGIRYSWDDSEASTRESSGVTWWKCNTGDNATYAPKKGPDGAADLNSGCGSDSDDIKIYATYDRNFGPAISMLSVTDTDDGEPGSRSTNGWTDAVAFKNLSYCLDLNKGVSGSHDLFTHYYTPCVAVNTNPLRSNYNTLLGKYNQIGYYTLTSPTTRATIEAALNTAQAILSDVNDGYTTYTQDQINSAATECATQSGRMSLTHSVSYTLNGGTVSGNPTTYDINTPPVYLKAPTKFGYTFTGWTGSNGSTPQTEVAVPNVISSGLSQYTTSNYYTASGRDHVFGNSFPVVSGMTYRVFVTARRTAGSLSINGGIWYAAGQTSGYAWDGVGGAFTYLKDAGNGWGVYYKDVVVPGGKQRGQFYVQIDQAASGGDTTWLLADCYVTALGVSLPIGLESYNVSNPYNAADRDHHIGNSIPVTPGKTYRVYVTAKQTAGSLPMNGGLWYTSYTEGSPWDGVGGSFTKLSDIGDGWGRYYKDVTVPSGRSAAQFYMQIEQAHGGAGHAWQLADMAVVDTALPNLSYTANWTPTNRTISYNLNGGAVSGNPTSYNIETTPMRLNNPTKTGYTFTGWTGSNGSVKSTDVSVPNVVSSGINYTTSNPYTASGRDHYFGNSFPVLSGMTYRVYVTAKRTAGSLNMNGGIAYAAGQTSGAWYDGVGGAFTWLKDVGDGWGVYYKDVTVPAGKQRGQFYVQLEQYSPYGCTWLLANCFVTTLFNNMPIGLEQYTTSNPLVCSGRDHRPGNQVPLEAGKVYRVYVTAKRTAGSRALNGGLWYNTNASGAGYDGYGAFTLQYEMSDGWARYYRDVTVPAGKDNATVFIQIDQSSATGFDTTWQCADMAIADLSSLRNLSYTANWQAITYNIGYTLNGGTLTSANPATYTVESNAITLNNPARTGYSFKGWSGTGLTGDANNPVTIAKGSTGDRSYTANWTTNSYSLQFNGNGNTGGSMNNQVINYDVETPITANTYTRAYSVTYKNNNGTADGSATASATFNGWATSAAGAKVYDNGQKVKNLTAVNGAVIPLYANWTPGKVTLPTPEKTGHTFKGWYKDAACTDANYVGAGGANYTPEANITLYAKWEVNSYAVTYTLGEGATTENAPLALNYGAGATFTVTLDAAHDQSVPTVTATGATVSQSVSGNVVTVTLSNVTGPVTVNAPTTKNTYTLTIVGDEGFTSNDRAKTVEHGDTLTFTVTLSEGYTQNAPIVTKDGAALTVKSQNGSAYTYEIDHVTADVTVSVTAQKNSYTVSVTGDDGATLSTTGGSAAHGENFSFSVTPKFGYTQTAPAVTVNGEALHYVDVTDGAYNYVIAGVTEAKSVEVSTTLNTYTVAFTAEDGAAVPDTATVTHGDACVFTVTLLEGYDQTAPVVEVNGVAVEAASVAGSAYNYEIEEVTENQTVIVSTTKNTYTVSFNETTGADVTYTGGLSVTHGEDFTFTVTAQTGYDQTAPAVEVNGTALQAESEEDGVYTYVVSEVKEGKEISVLMAKNQYTVSFGAAVGAAFAPSDAQTVIHGEDFSFSLTLEAGYDQTAPTVTVGERTLDFTGREDRTYFYTLQNVTEDMTVNAATEKNAYTVTLPVSGEGYTIDPAGAQTVSWGEDFSFTVTLSEGYTDTAPTVTVDGDVLAAAGRDGNTYSYTIETVTQAKTVAVSATVNTYAVTINADGGATVEADASPVNHGGDFSFTVTLNEGYTQTAPAVTVNGETLAADGNEGSVYSYKLSAVTEAKAVSVTTAINTYTVAVSGDEGATVYPLGDTAVSHGGSFTLTVTPNAGYTATAPTVTVNGAAITAAGTADGVYTYEITDITENKTVKAVSAKNTYPVTFAADDGATLNYTGTQTVIHGDDLHFTVTLNEGYDRTAPAVTVNGAALEALTVSEGVYSYKIGNITEAKAVAVTTTLNAYSVAMTGDDGALPAAADATPVPHGSDFTFTVTLREGYGKTAPAVTVNGATLAAAGSENDVYTYIVENVTEDLTITAASTLNTYEISFTADAGAAFNYTEPQTVSHGSDFSFTVTSQTGYTATAPEVSVNGASINAESAAEGVYTYTLTNISEDQAVSAASTLNTYTVIWANADGTVLETDENVPHGTLPAFDGEEPEKVADAEFTYHFLGWDKEISEATCDVTYTAVYDNVTNEYTVQFVNEDGTLLQEEVLLYGTTPEYKGNEPAKAHNAQFTYTFADWDAPIAKVTGDAVYTATFTATVNQYTVTFQNENGAEIVFYTLDYGMLPVYKGPALSKDHDEERHYSFAGWDSEIAAVTGNVTYTAVYAGASHVWNSGAVKTAATCVAEGEMIYTCGVCGQTRIAPIAVDLSNHAGPTEVRGYIAPTDEENGYSGDTYCAACNTLLSSGDSIHRTKGACVYCGGYHEGVWGSIVTAVHGILWLLKQFFRIGR